MFGSQLSMNPSFPLSHQPIIFKDGSKPKVLVSQGIWVKFSILGVSSSLLKSMNGLHKEVLSTVLRNLSHISKSSTKSLGNKMWWCCLSGLCCVYHLDLLAVSITALAWNTSLPCGSCLYSKESRLGLSFTFLF